MNEVNFVKKHGFVKTKEIIEMYNNGELKDCCFDIGLIFNLDCEYMDQCVYWLKPFVEAYELVKSHGGLETAQQEAHKDCFAYNKELLAACYLVNQCS